MCLYAKYLANMTQVSDVAPGPLVGLSYVNFATLYSQGKKKTNHLLRVVSPYSAHKF
jgi:hypothetical protein